MPSSAIGKLSVALIDPIVPLLKVPLLGFIAMGKVDLQAAKERSTTAMAYIFFMIMLFTKRQLKACPVTNAADHL